MVGHRIHIFGASGAGASTLGRALATELASQHFDTDDFFWKPTDPPFQQKRCVPDRYALMQEIFVPRRDWVLSGSMDSWSEGVDDRLTLAILLDLDTDTRLARLRAREAWRRQDPSGTAEMEAFLDWAASYDDGLLPGRNRARHLAWAETLSCPVMRLDSAPPVHELVAEVLAVLDPGRILA